jgi:hypothetical protein
MGLLRKTLQFGNHLELWDAAKPRAELPGVSWFVGRFIGAADVVARAWGPRWSRDRQLFGRAIGAWVLLLFWIAVPAALILRRVARLFF